jgi:hypothetical protein
MVYLQNDNIIDKLLALTKSEGMQAVTDVSEGDSK